MENSFALFEQARQSVSLAKIASLNALTGACGLSLGPAQISRLNDARIEALKGAGRVELGDGILAALISAFYDSPYIVQETYEETLADLQELFYAFKSESELPDTELLEAMRSVFDGRAGGSTDYLAGLSPEELIALSSD